MHLNFWLTMAISAIIPSIVGMIWYNPKVFGTAWVRAGNLDEAKLREGFNLPLTLGVCYLFSFMVSMLLSNLVIHQQGFISMIMNHIKEPDGQKDMADMLAKYGNEFRTFKHGALHGFLAGLFFAMPVIGFGTLWERRGFKYLAINTGYWILILMLMGGFICQFAGPMM